MTRKKPGITLGIISDTHGLLRPQAAEALQGVDMIIHAGDIGGAPVIKELELIAPVVAVRGNMDNDHWAYFLKREEVLDAGGHTVCVVHDLGTLSLDPERDGIRAVMHGHSHRPRIQDHEGILYINPGSAGPRRFTLPVSVALLQISGGDLRARIIELKP